MVGLNKRTCVPCEGKISPLTREEVQGYLAQVPGWTLRDDARNISRAYKMKNFVAAVEFIRKVADVAEKENHHPDIHLTDYRNLRIDLSTHAIGGLSDNDFIVAAKVNELPAEVKA